MVIDDDFSDGGDMREDPKNQQTVQMTSILGGREKETGKITESSKEEDEEVISQRHIATQQKNNAYQSSAIDKTRNLASFMEDNEDITLPLLLNEERLQTKVHLFKSPNTSKKWLNQARKGVF